MALHYQDEHVTLHHGDCLDQLAALPDASVDSVVTDPPYGLSNTTPAQVAETITRWVSGDREYLPSARGFMGHEWDGFVPPVAVWDECLRVLKPGGHLIAFAGSRTQDLMGLAVRLAGFEIRDSVAWLYGSGFPKSLDVSKAIDRAAGAERTVVGPYVRRGDAKAYPVNSTSSVEFNNPGTKGNITAPATDAARQWQGWGTALKPAFEPVTLARKPLEGTVAANVLEHGTGALNIDGCRIATAEDTGRAQGSDIRGGNYVGATRKSTYVSKSNPAGRWPANVVLDESQAEELDRQSGTTVSRAGGKAGAIGYHAGGTGAARGGHNDSGGASRFFYVAKAPKSERPVVDGTAHPTVKPLSLARWLVRMVTPPGGTVLDPFAGSGTTLEAAMLEGFHAIGVEREAEYLPLIQHRIDRAHGELKSNAEPPNQGAFSFEESA